MKIITIRRQRSHLRTVAIITNTNDGRFRGLDHLDQLLNAAAIATAHSVHLVHHQSPSSSSSSQNSNSYASSPPPIPTCSPHCPADALAPPPCFACRSRSSRSPHIPRDDIPTWRKWSSQCPEARSAEPARAFGFCLSIPHPMSLSMRCREIGGTFDVHGVPPFQPLHQILDGFCVADNTPDFLRCVLRCQQPVGYFSSEALRFLLQFRGNLSMLRRYSSTFSSTSIAVFA